MAYRLLLALSALGLLAAGPAAAATIRVSAGQATLASAIGRAGPGDSILVAEGLYKVNIMIRKPLTLLGGWDRDFRERDPERFRTILDGIGVEQSVVTILGRQGEEVWIEGFTIRNGWVDGNGGGLFVNGQAYVVLRENRFLDNYARYHGGGVCYFRGASGRVENNLFDGNSAVFHGGGLCLLDGARVEVAGNVFLRGRVVSDSGGGLAALRNCVIDVRNNRFEENFAIKRGGAISFFQGIEGTVTGNLIARNECGYMGGAIYAWRAFLHANRNTMVRNYGPANGGFRVDHDGSADLESNLVVRANGPWLFHEGPAKLAASGNVIHAAGRAEGTGAAEADRTARFLDPLLCDEADGDYRLRAGSPCLEGGAAGCYTALCGETPPPGEPPLRRIGR
ncbi:MAG: right-handed parallel beta-helix repeat-containing protein [Candidatus Eisenbacteria bacterium]